MLDTIIFDLGGVLIDWNPRYVFRTIFSTEEEMDYFFENICTHEWNLEQDAGKSLALATEERVAQFPKYEEPIRAFYGRWEEMLGGPVKETVALLRHLKDAQSHRLLALTNWSAETFPVALERYDFLHWFEGIVVSGVEKTIKPRPELYEILLHRYGVAPASAVFIDDNAANVAAAKKIGLVGVHYKSAQQLKEDLRGFGVGW
ncbi:MAG: HAD family hydrolase [Saprospiraceae bacterium]|nr:MAG: HAD family hydrolase [Saprospiraceae bacterium]